MARYRLRARNSAGVVDFSDLLTIEAAVAKATELRDAQFDNITLINVQTGTEITNLEAVLDVGIISHD